MAEPRLNDLDRLTVPDEQARVVVVPKVMEVRPGSQACLLQRLVSRLVEPSSADALALVIW